MHTILLVHRILDLLPSNPDSPTFDPSHIPVIRRLIKMLAAHAHEPLPVAAMKCSRTRAKWAYEHFGTLALIAGPLGISIQPLACPNAAPLLYRSVIESLWNNLRRNVDHQLELRATANAGLAYLSGPIDQLQVDHRAYHRVMARSPRVNKYEVSPEVFVLAEMGQFERWGWIKVFRR